jgi:hypothetical protein
MIKVAGTVSASLPPRTAFAYLSAFENTAEWDPWTPSVEKLSQGPVAVGHRYHAETLFRGKRQSLEYEVIELFDNHIKLRGENEKVVSFDSIDVRFTGAGCDVLYTAEFSIKGPMKLLQPFLTPAFMSLRDPALEGLRNKLNSL